MSSTCIPNLIQLVIATCIVKSPDLFRVIFTIIFPKLNTVTSEIFNSWDQHFYFFYDIY